MNNYLHVIDTKKYSRFTNSPCLKELLQTKFVALLPHLCIRLTFCINDEWEFVWRLKLTLFESLVEWLINYWSNALIVWPVRWIEFYIAYVIHNFAHMRQKNGNHPLSHSSLMIKFLILMWDVSIDEREKFVEWLRLK